MVDSSRSPRCSTALTAACLSLIRSASGPAERSGSWLRAPDRELASKTTSGITHPHFRRAAEGKQNTRAVVPDTSDALQISRPCPSRLPRTGGVCPGRTAPGRRSMGPVWARRTPELHQRRIVRRRGTHREAGVEPSRPPHSRRIQTPSSPGRVACSASIKTDTSSAAEFATNTRCGEPNSRPVPATMSSKRAHASSLPLPLTHRFVTGPSPDSPSAIRRSARGAVAYGSGCA